MDAELALSQYAIGRGMGKPHLAQRRAAASGMPGRLVKFSLTVSEEVRLLCIGNPRIVTAARSINGICTHAQHQSDYAVRARAFGRRGNGRLHAHLTVRNGGVTCSPRDGHRRCAIWSKLPLPLS